MAQADRTLEALARDRGPDLLAYATLLTGGDRAAAQDLVQDAIVKVFGRMRAGFTPDVAEAYVRRTILDLRAALRDLAPQERAVVVLRFYEDLTVPDVADRMGLAEGTVKRYLSNALHRLGARLGPVDDDDAVGSLPVERPSGGGAPEGRHAVERSGR